jgi:hypothetical protein
MHFNLHPWDVGRLTVPELNAYVEALEDIARAQRDAQRRT